MSIGWEGYGLCTACGHYHGTGYACPWTRSTGAGWFTLTWPPKVVAPTSTHTETREGAKLVDNGDGTYRIEAGVRVRAEDLTEAAALVAKLRELGKRS